MHGSQLPKSVIEDYRKLPAGVNSNLEISGAFEKNLRQKGRRERDNSTHPRRPEGGFVYV
jgi:hypothetical protein